MHAITPRFGFLFLFALIYVAFFALYHQVPDRLLAEVVYRWLINEPAAQAITLLAPQEAVRVEGHRLLSPRVVLEIVRGCDGSGAFFLVAAAMLAFRARVQDKILGVIAAFVLIFLLNEARVVGLYFAVAYRPGWFTPLHSYIIPTFLIAAICVQFVIWARFATRRDIAID